MTFAPGHARAGRHRLHLPFGRAGRRDPRLGARAPHGLLALREPRQPGRPQRVGSARARLPPTPRRGSSRRTSRASPTAGGSSRRCAPRRRSSRWCCSRPAARPRAPAPCPRTPAPWRARTGPSTRPCRQAGAVRAASVEELFDLARGLASQPLPRGRRLLVVTNGGGLGDRRHRCRARGRASRSAPLDEATRGRLAAVLPPTASLGNPVDLVGDADAARYSHALHALGGDERRRGARGADRPGGHRFHGRGARRHRRYARTGPIPLAAAFVGGARVAPGARALEEAGIPCYPFPEPAVRTLAGMALLAERRLPDPPAARRARRRRPQARIFGSRLRGGFTGALGDARPRTAARRPTASHCGRRGRAATAGGGGRRRRSEWAFRWRSRSISPDISHKTEVGGVRLGLRSAAEVAVAAGEMLRRVTRGEAAGRHRPGFLVQPMAPPGKELLLGMVRDAAVRSARHGRLRRHLRRGAQGHGGAAGPGGPGEAARHARRAPDGAAAAGRAG